MTTATKTFLAVSVAGFVAGGIVDFGNVTTNPMWTVALPVGAIFLGVFLISLVLEKEVAKFDEEQAVKVALARRCLADRPRVRTEDSKPPNAQRYENQFIPIVR